MTPPQYQAPVDPNLQAETDAATKAKTDALQLRLQSDTSDVMARYGTRVALSGGGARVQGGGPISPLQLKALPGAA